MIQVKWRNLLIVGALFLAANVGGSYLLASSTVDRVAQINYDNSISDCLRSNDARSPINEFFVVFQADEAEEKDDPKVAVAAAEAEEATGPIPCEREITRPDGVDAYRP